MELPNGSWAISVQRCPLQYIKQYASVTTQCYHTRKLHTKKEGIIYNSEISKGLECYMDADFAGVWSREVGDDADNFMSRIGMVIMYDNCPVYCRRSLQT